jgi:HPt (histidine-containing phosphotransfer) domain-containing protein
MIDRKKLLDMMDGDAEIVAKFLDAFKSQVNRQLPLMNLYLQQGNFSMLSNTAHIMKTQTAYLGLHELSELSGSIEKLADAQAEIEVLQDQVAVLEKQLTQIIQTELP